VGSAITSFEDQIGRLGCRVYKCGEPGCRPDAVPKSGKYRPTCGYYIKVGKMDKIWLSKMEDGFLHIWTKGKPHTREPPEPSSSAEQLQVCGPADLLTC